ncbi:MAG: molybdenum cofactor biosynthesis protein MoeA [Solirubrobacterales bacterium]|nr:molybdenum cofactor biosynthesis protein MoeA [Solirubrobacterales bacterium]
MASMTDSIDRRLRDLRVSVTDRCNLRCTYCMPREVFGSEYRFLQRSQLLSFEEIERLVRVLAGHGVRKVRLTGGEPLLRRELDALVGMLAALDGIEDVALTTNGTALAAQAERLARAGLDRVTVSLDALDEQVFQSMSDTRFPLARVLEGIEAAESAGLGPVKVNMVVRRGVNDHCVLEMAERFRGGPQILRFIEYMDVGTTNGWRLDDVVPASEILARLHARWPLRRLAAERPGEVAARWAYEDGGGEIGVISSVTEPFCDGCTRARLSADGQLYTCLFAERGHDLRALLRTTADDAQLADRVNEIWTARADRYSQLRAERTRAAANADRGLGGGEGTRAPRERRRVEMSYIGG